MGTGRADNNVNMISDRKADGGLQLTDNVADALFSLILESRFPSCSEPQVTNICSLINALTESHGVVSQRGVMLTAHGA